jgi:hypothetical protein
MMEFFVSYLKLLMSRGKGLMSLEPEKTLAFLRVDRTPKLVMEREPNSIR